MEHASNSSALGVATLRQFNRVYTSRLGLLHSHLDGSPFSLSEARLLYELAHRTDPTAAGLGRALRLDRAQVSRTLRRFADRGLIEIRSDPSHGRNQLLSLTAAGQTAFGSLDADTETAVGTLLDSLPLIRRSRLLEAAAAIMQALDSSNEVELTLRDLRAGDLGLVTARQAILYAEEFGWNSDYEALVARIIAEFHTSYDPARDAAWIAEMDDRMVGSIFLVRGDTPKVAKLRLLYVEPYARGAGVGARLVSSCVERARELGYDRLDLWTNSVLAAARSLYQRAGFELVEETPHRSFGHDLLGQTWSLPLR
jgi:DNA-binding MarR family transcriptional regulator/N-acetylglutamate synthase-like GNAT family acetyltransferase